MFDHLKQMHYFQQKAKHFISSPTMNENTRVSMCCELICLTLIVLGLLFCFCFCFWVSCNVLLNLSSVKDVGKEIWLFKRNCYCVPIILQCNLRIVHITNDWKVKKYIINWFDSSCWEYKETEMNVFTFFAWLNTVYWWRSYGTEKDIMCY